MTLTPATLWPPLVKVCIAWLTGHLTGIPVVYDTTTVVAGGQAMTLSDAVAVVDGVIQVIRTPGGGGGDDLDQYGNIDLYFYGRNAGTVEATAQAGHTALMLLSGRAAAGWRIDEVRCEASPGDVPYADPMVQRWVGSYQITSVPQQ